MNRHAGVLFALFWLALGVVVYLGMEALTNPISTRVSFVGTGEVHIERARDGAFYVEGTINGDPVLFMVDTGATTVAVGAADAARLRLAEGVAARVDTAGGMVVGEAVVGNTVAVGNLVVDKLRVMVIPEMPGRHALLGLNFLRHVAVNVEGNRMTLRPPAPPEGRP